MNRRKQFGAAIVACAIALMGAMLGSATMPGLLSGQTFERGVITGRVIDSETGESLIGVNVVIEGTTRGAATDVEGRFTIQNVEPGRYTLVVSIVSYARKRIENLSVKSGQAVSLHIVMTPEVIQTQEVVVEARAVLSSEGALLAQHRKAPAISDGISAEQIKRTPDATSSDALKRLTGISIVDNKFIFVRGVTDRYNQTMLNGIPVTSTDAEKRSFSFDMVPANLLENTIVVKSATPDLPGDFTGGLVQLNTLDFPDQTVLRASIGSAYNSMTTWKPIFGSASGRTDWLGFDDGSRAFPGNGTSSGELARSLPNNWAPRSFRAPTNTAFSFVYGSVFEELGGESNQLGVITAVTYRGSFQRNEKIIDDDVHLRYNVGTKDEYSVLLSALANLSYKFAETHKVSLKNNSIQTGEDEVSKIRSEDNGTMLENVYTIVNWNQRSMYSGQLTGEHVLSQLGGISVDWRASLSTSKSEVPDRKEVTYYRWLGNTSDPFEAATNQRSWSKLNDKVGALGLDMTVPLNILKIKAGFQSESKKTDYRIRYFNVSADYPGGASSDLTTLPLEKIYDPANYGRGKFLFNESSKATDTYDAAQSLAAAYIMADVPFELMNEKFRFVGGARLEESSQRVNVPRTLLPGGPVETTELRNSDLLPSFNLTYTINTIMNLRFAYSHSVNRPEFRELAPTGFYDFVKYESVGGNPNLKRSLAKNYDIRFEMFPGIGELIAVSYFRKQIVNAIEEQLVHTSTRARSWFNSDIAVNSGWEFEVRKSLGFLGGLFQHFSLSCNYTRVYSAVDFLLTSGNSLETVTTVNQRPMQGQSPYMVNASLFFSEPSLGTSINILYNKFGRRLDAVGFLTSDIYEEPRDLVDLSISQRVWTGFEAKFTVRNLTNQKRVFTRDGKMYEQTASGSTYSLQFSQSF